MVLSANLLLSVAVGLAIFNNQTASQATQTAKETASNLESRNAPKTGAKSETYPAISRAEAVSEARKDAGRPDPMTASGLTAGAMVNRASKSTKQSQENLFVPPPPPVQGVAPTASSSIMAANNSVSRQTNLSLQEEVPARIEANTPMNKAFKLAGIKLSGVIGNKAILLMRREGARRSERPEVICLAPGDQISTMSKVPISVVSVDPDRVTLELAGNRYVKPLPDIH